MRVVLLLGVAGRPSVGFRRFGEVVLAVDFRRGATSSGCGGPGSPDIGSNLSSRSDVCLTRVVPPEQASAFRASFVEFGAVWIVGGIGILWALENLPG